MKTGHWFLIVTKIDQICSILHLWSLFHFCEKKRLMPYPGENAHGMIIPESFGKTFQGIYNPNFLGREKLLLRCWKLKMTSIKCLSVKACFQEMPNFFSWPLQNKNKLGPKIIFSCCDFEATETFDAMLTFKTNEAVFDRIVIGESRLRGKVHFNNFVRTNPNTKYVRLCEKNRECLHWI